MTCNLRNQPTSPGTDQPTSPGTDQNTTMKQGAGQPTNVNQGNLSKIQVTSYPNTTETSISTISDIQTV